MNKYILDSWAWIEYFDGARRGERVKEIILDPRNEVFTHCVSVAEIISKAKRTGKDVESVCAAIASNSNTIEVSLEDSKNAGIIHAITKTRNRNFSLADAFVLAAARKLKAKVVTGDPDFKNIDDAVML
ncbi:MAG: PIN domain-containing protein [Nitrososphaerales archaeon]